MDWLNPTYFWTLGLAPVVAALFFLAAWRRRTLIQLFGDRVLVSRLAGSISKRRRRWKAAFRVAGILMITIALIGPRFGTQIKEVQREGIDLVIALDVSASMMAEDIAPNRLERAKNEIKNLVEELKGDRIALVTFAGDAFIQCPLTTDYSALQLFLDVADPSLIPTPGTDFGTALKMAIQAFEGPSDSGDQASRTKAVLFVSDGENHVADLQAILDEARQSNIVMYAAGVGETDGAPIPEYQNGRRVDYKKDRAGAVITTKLEESVLQDLSKDGSYFRIAKTSSSLGRITVALDQLDKTSYGAEEFEEYEERFQWPLLFGILLLFAEWVLPERVRIKSESSLSETK